MKKLSIPLSGEPIEYKGHKDKSSRITIIPTGGVLCKQKERNEGKAEHELLALLAWQRLLSAYNSQLESGQPLELTSPVPYGLDDEGKLYMGLLPGVSADAALCGNYIEGENAYTSHQVRMDFSRRFGRLVRVKEVERLAHYDFQLRHLIHDINGSSLGVIDVENSKVDEVRVIREHRAIKQQIDAVFKNSGKIRRNIQTAFDEGYESVADPYPILEDVRAELAREFSEERANGFLETK